MIHLTVDEIMHVKFFRGPQLYQSAGGQGFAQLNEVNQPTHICGHTRLISYRCWHGGTHLPYGMEQMDVKKERISLPLPDFALFDQQI